MGKNELIKELQGQCRDVHDLIAGCDEAALNRKPGEKWSIAEQAEHLCKSVSPINLAMALPKITFYVFGRVSFSRPYDEIVSLYRIKLDSGARASAAFVPPAGKQWNKSDLLTGFDRAYETYAQRLDAWPEGDLDTYRLPHPIIGALTMREMAFFTHYHLGHHFRSMRQLAG